MKLVRLELRIFTVNVTPMSAPARPFIAWILLLATVLPAAAHPLIQNPLWVVLAPDKIRVRAHATLREVQLAGGREEKNIDALAAQYGRYWLEHFEIKADGTALKGNAVRVAVPPEARGVIDSAQIEKVRLVFDFEFPLRSPPKRIEFSHTIFANVEYALGQPWIVSYLLGTKYADEDRIDSALLVRGSSHVIETKWQTAPRPAEPHGSTFREFFQHGVWHILTGYDHLLFLTALILAATSFWELFKVIGAFTIAHSLTLLLSALNIFRLPEWFVEPVIALSIVFVAVENILFPKRALGWSRLVVAFVFGLVHGLGFAGGLLDALAEMPAVSLTLAIVGFSLGVEAAHQFVMVPLYSTLAFVRHRSSADIGTRVLRFGSATVSLCGLFYLVLSVKTFAR